MIPNKGDMFLVYDLGLIYILSSYNGINVISTESEADCYPMTKFPEKYIYLGNLSHTEDFFRLSFIHNFWSRNDVCDMDFFTREGKVKISWDGKKAIDLFKSKLAIWEEGNKDD